MLPSDTLAPLPSPRLLVLDTATEVVHVALATADQVRVQAVDGGAQASRTTLPALQALMADAGLAWAELDAIAFGQGPGAFTGLRTACSVAQGLALAAGCPVMALDTLMAVAEDARQSQPADWSVGDEVWVAQDARMGELYVAAYRWQGSHWQAQAAPQLWALNVPAARWSGLSSRPRVAGNALVAQAAAFEGLDLWSFPQAVPSGAALAALARQAWSRGEVLDAAMALPLYVRDKVAQTTQERQTAKQVKLEAMVDRAMTESDIDAVLALEQQACPHPSHAWSQDNYRSSLRSGYWMRVRTESSTGRIVGVCVAMDGVDEIHLLNIVVDKTVQGSGVARGLLATLYERCRAQKATQLWLEVRPSNQRAIGLYRRQGFADVGVRKAYYPAAQGREDAVVMRMVLGAIDALV